MRSEERAGRVCVRPLCLLWGGFFSLVWYFLAVYFQSGVFSGPEREGVTVLHHRCISLRETGLWKACLGCSCHMLKPLNVRGCQKVVKQEKKGAMEGSVSACSHLSGEGKQPKSGGGGQKQNGLALAGVNIYFKGSYIMPIGPKYCNYV